ncbi:hypothetical protein APUTEX25_000928, partial [Auxenochlorella protothecoides]
MKHRAAWISPLSLQGQRSPVTPYFFWPKEEAWDLMKETLEGESSWIPEGQVIEVLNSFTSLINYWQSDNPTLKQAKDNFPNARFHG